MCFTQISKQNTTAVSGRNLGHSKLNQNFPFYFFAFTLTLLYYLSLVSALSSFALFHGQVSHYLIIIALVLYWSGVCVCVWLENQTKTISTKPFERIKCVKSTSPHALQILISNLGPLLGICSPLLSAFLETLPSLLLCAYVCFFLFSVTLFISQVYSSRRIYYLSEYHNDISYTCAHPDCIFHLLSSIPRRSRVS